MELSTTTLDQIKCSKCDNILSHAPVYRLADGSALCVSCRKPDQPAFRDSCYEALAKYFLFPCRNLIYGCKFNVPFSEENQLSPHEKACKLHACPLGSASLCKWKGIITKIEEHCKDQHEDVILFNPLTLKYNLANANYETFLVRAFQKLFSVKIFFFKESPTFYLKILLLDEAKKVDKYQYSLVLKHEKAIIMAESNVAVHDLENEVPALKLDTGGTNKIISITVKIHHANDNILDTCPKCGALIRHMYYRDFDGWWCEDCAPDKETCNINDYCLFLDFPLKLAKHSKYFCPLLTRCCICEMEVKGNLFDHYTSAHGLENSTWRASEFNVEKWCLVSCESGLALCRYELYELGFELVVLHPLKSEKLKDFGCEVQVTQPETSETKTFTLPALYDDESDWYIDIKKQNFSSWSQYLDVHLNIYKK